MDNQRENENRQCEQQQQQRQQRQLPALRSIHNRQSSFVRFINTTQHNVTIYWIDYNGKRVSYRVLGSRKFIDINTFVTHPWIFVDEETKDRFLGNGQEVYFPEPWFAKCPNIMDQPELPTTRVERTHVYITLPVYSLRDLCLRLIKRRLRFDRHAFGLEIPWSLQRELYNMHPRKPDTNERDLASQQL